MRFVWWGFGNMQWGTYRPKGALKGIIKWCLYLGPLEIVKFEWQPSNGRW